MHSTRRNTLLIVLFAIVFAVMFAVEVLQSSGNSVQVHPHSTSTLAFCQVPCILPLSRAQTLVNLTDIWEICEE